MDSTRDEIIAKAAGHDIKLEPGDFGGTEDHPTLDGMSADEWLDAMTMD